MFDWERLNRECDEKRHELYRADGVSSSAAWALAEAKEKAARALDERDFARWSEKYLRGLYEEWKKAQAAQVEPAKEAP